MRLAKIKRQTKETNIELEINLDGSVNLDIQSGIGFFDHLLTSLASNAHFDLQIHCQGDLEVDGHHSVEDLGIVLGSAIKEALGDKKGITRYATEFIPMDEALTMVSLDLSGRPYLLLKTPPLKERVGQFETELLEEFLKAFSNHLALTLHVHVLEGRNSHHILESIFKALGRSLKKALALDPTLVNKNIIPSTKGILD